MRVGRPQPDGYHDVATAYQALSLWEELRAEPDDDLVLSFTGPIPADGLPLDDRNIVLRAAHLLQARTGHRGGARIQVYKRVPIAGGVGGGSPAAAPALAGPGPRWGPAPGGGGPFSVAARLGAGGPLALAGGAP